MSNSPNEDPIDPSDDPVQPSSADDASSDGQEEAGPAAKTVISDFHERKLKERRQVWRINRRLAAITAISVTVVGLMSVASYSYHSLSAGSTFITRADAAAQEGETFEEVEWLNRYLLLRPFDDDVLVRVAEAADRYADEAPMEERATVVQAARRRLSNSLATLGDRRPEASDHLRHLLIRRLLQLGGRWFREAERQVILIDGEETDPTANKALALALLGQVQLAIYDDRNPTEFSREQYWEWLASQKPGFVIQQAVKSNPTDLDVLSGFLALVRTSPEMFGPASSLEERAQTLEEQERRRQDQLARQNRRERRNDSEDKKDRSREYRKDLADQISRTLARLQEMDGSRAKLILYSYQSAAENGAEAAEKYLEQAAREAADRLQNPSPTATDEAEDAVVGTPTAADLALGRRFSQAYWDYICVGEACRVMADSALRDVNGRMEDGDAARRLDLVEDWYELLSSLEIDEVSATMRQTTFLNAGRLASARGRIDEAIEIWQEGLKEVSVDNLELLGAITIALGEKERSEEEEEEAKQMLQKLEKAITAQSDRLIQLTRFEISMADRTAISRAIELARWRANVARAQIEIAGPQDAESSLRVIRALKEAFESQAEIRPEERVLVATRLAEQYRRLGSWDQAAETLSDACEIMPGNDELHAQAASAWARAGNQMRAIDEWRLVNNSSSILTQIAALEGAFQYQMGRPAELQDFSQVRSSLLSLKERLREARESFEKNPGESTEEQRAALTEIIDGAGLALRILEISLPPAGLPPSSHFASDDLIENISKLAADYPLEAKVQAYAYERFVAAQRDQKAAEALQSLTTILGEGSTQLALIQARVDALKKRPIDAAKRLIAQIELDPGDAARLAASASNYAKSGGDEQLAYDALLLIPESSRSPRELFAIYLQAGRLPDMKAEQQKWLETLEKREGTNGTYWKFIRVSDLVEELAREMPVERTDPRLVRARQMLTSLVSARPRWGEALALKGWLSAIGNRPEEAVDELRFAIAAGDQRLSTRRLLWEQLIRLGRGEEADEDIRDTAVKSGVEVDPYGQFRITSAVGRGDPMKAVDAAKEGLKSRPNDPIAHLVVAKTISYSVARLRDLNANVQTPEKKKEQIELIEQARVAVEKAKELSDEITFALASTILDVELTHGEADNVDQAEQMILDSDLGDRDRNFLLGRIHADRGDFDKAIASFQAADEAASSFETRIALANLYRRTGRIDEEIKALQVALAKAPTNSEIRERLANAIIQRDGDSVRWEDLERLLASGRNARGSNRLLYATLLGSKGGREQQMEALQILRMLVQENNSLSYNASIVQGALLLRLVDSIEEGGDQEEKQRLLDEARAIYERHSRGVRPSPDDLFRYAVFLLTRGTEEEQTNVDEIATRLLGMPEGALRSLELGILIRRQRGESESIPGWLDSWADNASEAGGQNSVTRVDVAAGTALLRLGFTEKALTWFEKAYKSDPAMLTNYVIALSRAKQYSEAAEIAAAHYKEHNDARSAMLLVEALLAAGKIEAADAYEDLLSQAVKAHGQDINLLESVATLAMQRGRAADAVAIYRRVLSMDPLRVRALNNLAIACSQLPKIAQEGLRPIEQAIKLAGNNPELLDTKGTVLLQLGEHQQALEIFESIIKRSDDPRYQFHKILTLIALDRKSEAATMWEILDKENLDVNGLAPNEKKIWVQMLDDFHSYGASGIRSTGSI